MNLGVLTATYLLPFSLDTSVSLICLVLFIVHGVPGYKELESCAPVVRMRFIQPLAQLHGKNERLQFPQSYGYHDITEVPLSKIRLPRVTSTLGDCCRQE